jgi:hypothetical protein
MREIKYCVFYNGVAYEVETKKPKRKDHKGWYLENGYVMRLVKNHPVSNKRGYVAEHRLVMEQKLGRFLVSKEIVHHIDGNRQNNDFDNLKLVTPRTHFSEHDYARNTNGQFVASEPIFSEIKYRLYDQDNGITQIYTLQELISKTFRRGKFSYRGRFTGLKDKNGKEIYESDIVKDEFNEIYEIKYLVDFASFGMEEIGNRTYLNFLGRIFTEDKDYYQWEVIGNIHESPDLLEK